MLPMCSPLGHWNMESKMNHSNTSPIVCSGARDLNEITLKEQVDNDMLE